MLGTGGRSPAAQPPAPAFCSRGAGKSPISYTNFKHNQMWEMKLLNSFCARGGGRGGGGGGGLLLGPRTTLCPLHCCY